MRQAVSYGPSPQSTLTLSSLTRRGVLCVQRQVTALDGSVHRAPGYPAAGGVGVLGDRAAAAVGGGVPAAGAAVKREKGKARRGQGLSF